MFIGLVSGLVKTFPVKLFEEGEEATIFFFDSLGGAVATGGGGIISGEEDLSLDVFDSALLSTLRMFGDPCDRTDTDSAAVGLLNVEGGDMRGSFINMDCGLTFA